MWILKLKSFFSIVWQWLKGHWSLLVILVGVLYVLFLMKNKQDALKTVLNEYKTQIDRNKTDMAELRRIHQESIDRQLEINRRYQETIDRIEKNYRDTLATLDNNRRNEIKRIITENHDDPNTMAQQLNSLLGIPLYSSNP